MAIKKSCDNCDRVLNRDGEPFLQFHGSISEQIEDGKGLMKYRYLTAHYQHKLAFCNLVCTGEWVDKQRAEKPYQQPESDQILIHT